MHLNQAHFQGKSPQQNRNVSLSVTEIEGGDIE